MTDEHKGQATELDDDELESTAGGQGTGANTYAGRTCIDIPGAVSCIAPSTYNTRGDS